MQVAVVEDSLSPPPPCMYSAGGAAATMTRACDIRGGSEAGRVHLGRATLCLSRFCCEGGVRREALHGVRATGRRWESRPSPAPPTAAEAWPHREQSNKGLRSHRAGAVRLWDAGARPPARTRSGYSGNRTDELAGARGRRRRACRGRRRAQRAQRARRRQVGGRPASRPRPDGAGGAGGIAVAGRTHCREGGGCEAKPGRSCSRHVGRMCATRTEWLGHTGSATRARPH